MIEETKKEDQEEVKKEENKIILSVEETIKKEEKKLKKEKKEISGRAKITPIPSEGMKIISFDVYFSMAMKNHRDVKPHHKRPMEIFFQKECGLLATKERFDKAFKKY